MRTISRVGAVAIAALPVLFACSESIPLDKKTYAGNLPGYGPTELTVYTVQKTDKISSVQVRADLLNSLRLYEINDMDLDGKFDMARVPGEGIPFYPQSPGTTDDFKQIESLATYAISQRGIRLQEIKK